MISYDEKTEALMGAALAGELSPEERAAFEKLLEESPEARSEYESILGFRDKLAGKWNAGEIAKSPTGGEVIAFPARGFRWAAGLALAASLVVAVLLPTMKEIPSGEKAPGETPRPALVSAMSPERSENVEPVLLPGEGLEDLSMGELALFLPEDEVDAIIEAL